MHAWEILLAMYIVITAGWFIANFIEWVSAEDKDPYGNQPTFEEAEAIRTKAARNAVIAPLWPWIVGWALMHTLARFFADAFRRTR